MSNKVFPLNEVGQSMRGIYNLCSDYGGYAESGLTSRGFIRQNMIDDQTCAVLHW